jgi:membrane-associated protease RseP (regulator of RpoE activity)
MQPVPDPQSSQLEIVPAEAAVGHAPASEVVEAELVEQETAVYRRRLVVPLVTFVLTCFSTFFVGALHWSPGLLTSLLTIPFSIFAAAANPYTAMPIRLEILERWDAPAGFTYMACVLAILLSHEMGHFVMTLIHRVRASLPYFVPFPVSPLGTMGAVIGMDGSQADRKQIFDIGLAGPLAGLIVAVPIIWIGAQRIDLVHTAPAEHRIELPLAMRLLVEYFHPGQYNPQLGVGFNQLNAWFMAGWVGLLVTGLNMMPVSQLDGGHVTYALFGRGAHWLARGFMVVVFIYIGIMSIFYAAPVWLLMALLVVFIGTDHPPTRDDSVPLGWFRKGLGLVSLLIPVFCFVPNPFH